MHERHIVKTKVTIEGGTIESIDTIEHERRLWLVPVWIDTPAIKQKQPLLIVRMDQLPYQEWDDGDYVLNTILPRWIFWDGNRPLPETNLEVREKPDIWFETLKKE